MRQTAYRYFGQTAVAVTLAFLFVCVTIPRADAQNSRMIRLDQGTVIPVRLDDSLSSDNSSRGDPFTATLKTDYDSGSYLGLPSGTRIEGTVKEARPRQGRDPGMLEL